VSRIIIFTAAALMFVSAASADVFVTSDGTGTYVGGLISLNSEGGYIEGTPAIAPDGSYVDGTPKKEFKSKKWQSLKKDQTLTLASSKSSSE